MVRAMVASGVLALGLFAATEARAQKATALGDFGDQGQFIVGADRLVPVLGYESNKVTINNNGTTISVSDSQSYVSFFGSNNRFNAANPGAAGNIPTGPLFYNVPRLGLDYVVVPHVTVGGNIMALFSFGGTHEAKTVTGSMTQTTSVDEPNYVGFGFAPRGGYILNINDWLSFWPRGGFSFWTISAKRTAQAGNQQVTISDSWNVWAINLEGQLVIHPIPHFGFTVGAVVDIPLTGSAKEEQDQGNMQTIQNADFTEWHVGVVAGLLGYF